MAIYLTPNAIEMICDPRGVPEDLYPTLQVTDVKLLSAGQNNNGNNPDKQRYRVLLSDGVHLQQGMLATQLNDLVSQKRLQKGSIVELSEFVSQVIQNRKIIIIVALNVILERCDQIGEPVLFGQGLAPQPPVDQPRNPQPYGGPTAAPLQNVTLNAPNEIGMAVLHNTRPNPGSNTQSYGNSFNGNPNSRGFSATNGPMYPKEEYGSRNQASTTVLRSYSDQNRNFTNSRQEGPPTVPYNRSVQPIYQQPHSAHMNRGPIAKNDSIPTIMPIAALNPFAYNKWAIKARVTAKKEKRSYHNARGDGQVFSFDLLDSDGGEIQVTCFNQVVDKFYDIIEAGKVYVIAIGSVKPADKKFNHLNNDYTIHLESTSIVELCREDDVSIPEQQFHFRSISDIEGMQNNAILDLIGVVSSIFPTAHITRKKDRVDIPKKSLQLKDMSGRSVDLTLWGDFCGAQGDELQCMVDSGVNPVLVVKGGRVNDFNGKSVGTISSSQLFINPNIPEALGLKEWFEREGKNVRCPSISREAMGMGGVRKTVSQIKDEHLGTKNEPDWIVVNAKISFMKSDNFTYPACPLQNCNRKVVINNGDGTWECDKCAQSFQECDYRYILSFQIQDHTGITWVTAFQECGEQIMGVSAREMANIKNEGDPEKYGEILKRLMFTQYLFKLKVKEETYNDEQRVKCTVYKVDNLDMPSESRHLLDMIASSVEDPDAIFGKSPIVMGNRSPGLMGGVKQEVANNDYGGRRNMNMGVGTLSYGVGGQSPAAAVYNNTGVSVKCVICNNTGHSKQDCPNRSGNMQMSYSNNGSPGFGSGGPVRSYGPPPSGGVGRYGVAPY
ncbi:hypothetical protein ACHQM5_007874 [Ranunculus cassubicifolius]